MQTTRHRGTAEPSADRRPGPWPPAGDVASHGGAGRCAAHSDDAGGRVRLRPCHGRSGRRGTTARGTVAGQLLEVDLGDVPGMANKDFGRNSPQFRSAAAACRNLLPPGIADDGSGP